MGDPAQLFPRCDAAGVCIGILRRRRIHSQLRRVLRACRESASGVTMAALKAAVPSYSSKIRTAVTSRRIIQAELLLLCPVLAAFIWFAVTIYRSPYLPSAAISDGIGYFVQAKSFYLNHT